MSDIEKTLKEMIAEEVNAQLAPFIAKINEAIARGAVDVGGLVSVKIRRTRKPRDPNAAPRTVKPIITDAARAAVSKWTIGDVANYKQGRGDFNGKVVGIDVNGCTITIKRDADGKEVVRPADKIYAAKDVVADVVADAPVAVEAAPAEAVKEA